MAYIDIIKLEDAKDYLGVDGDSRDAEISRMIRTALRMVEDFTSHILVPREKRYYTRYSCANVYDYPITAVVFPTSGLTSTEKTLYSTYSDSNGENTYIDLTVGYADISDIPPPLVEAAYMILESIYNQKETIGTLPMPAMVLMGPYRRFLI